MLGRTTAAIAVTVFMATSAAAHANGNKWDNDRARNSRPVQQVKAQIEQLQQAVLAQLSAMQRAMMEEIHALQARVDAVENNLQTQINAINENFAVMRDQVVTAADGVSALQQRVASGEQATAALESSVATLRGQVAEVDTRIASVEANLTALQATTNANANDIITLQQQAVALRQQSAGLQELIDMHETQIAALQSEDERVRLFLANMVNATCESGEAISAIVPGGLIVCSKLSGPQSTYSTFVAGTMNSSGLTAVNLACRAGYTAVSGGYYRASVPETLQYLSSLWFAPVYQPFYTPSGTQQLFTGHMLSPTWSYLQRDPVAVLSSRTESAGYRVDFMYAPQGTAARPYYEASVTCARAQ
jgi:septal ring factor EnvC (AmiA/AmiB activator)